MSLQREHLRARHRSIQIGRKQPLRLGALQSRLFHCALHEITSTLLPPPATCDRKFRCSGAVKPSSFPTSAAVHLCRGSASISPFPAKSPAPRQSLRTTYLPDRAKSAWSGTAPEPSSTLLPPGAALHASRRYQTENPHDPSAPPASHRLQRPAPRIPPALSRSLSPYAGTTTAAGSPLHAARCDRSKSSGSTRRANASSRETPSETRLASYRPRPPDHSRSGIPAHTPAAETRRSATRTPFPNRLSAPRRSPLLPATVFRLRLLNPPRWLLPPYWRPLIIGFSTQLRP